MDLDGRLHGEEIGGVEEGETIIRIYSVRKKIDLQEKEERKRGGRILSCLVVLVSNPSIQKTKEERSQVQGHPELLNEIPPHP